mgnify:FL=1
MKSKVFRTVLKSLPVVSSLALGVGFTLAVVHRNKLEDKVADKLLARQIYKENIPLQ